jgi:hypothetical protein
VGPVTGDHGDATVAGGGQCGAGPLRQVRIDLDGGDVASAEPVREERGGVAGAGADFQHPHPRLDLTGRQHQRDDVRAGC